MLEEERFVTAAHRGAAPLKERVLDEKRLAGTYGRNWRGDDSFICLTGNAQLAIVFFLLEEIHPGKGYAEAGCTLTAGLRRSQDLDSRHLGIRGGVKGSFPVDGTYFPLALPNWAAKFLLDALMMESALDGGDRGRWARGG